MDKLDRYFYCTSDGGLNTCAIGVQPILNKIADLGNNPRPAGYKKLKGRHGYRVRVGDYRIIYDIYDKELIIDVIALGHRKDIYG